MITHFFSTGGRIGPSRFLVSAVLGVLVLFACRAILATGPTSAYPVVGAIAGATLAKIFAEGGRRCHDVGRSGAVGLVLGMGIMALVALAGLSAPGSSMGTSGAIVSLILASLGTATFLLPGDKSDNRFGLAPERLKATPGQVHSARTLGWTSFAIIGTACIGLLLSTISEGMRDDRDRRVDRMSGSRSAEPGVAQ
ncbi:MAG: DUF805 domain-containing protein [Oxalobacteraceae bacterium]|nr:MAG: DUF805 domain-containing protein [Oxalobacteraceae bacterium]